MILKSTKSIAKTIGRLKEFYKIKLSKDELFEIDINILLEHVIDLTRHNWKNISESTGSFIEIRKEFQSDLPLTKVDESEFIEALINIVINACEAMNYNGTLTFSTCKLDDNIVIRIMDTSIGMNKDTLLHCMDPFYSTKDEKGTGLGLSMVFGVIDRHKGEIKIESERNKGTTISLILPINIENEENKQIDEIVKLLKPIKILNGEDDLVISEMLKQMLKKKDNTVDQAGSGKLGLELFKQSIEKGEPYDLVITDLCMAEMDGLSLSRQLKDLNPNIPIILFTGWGALIEKDDYRTIDYLMKKPIMKEELFKAINSLFK